MVAATGVLVAAIYYVWNIKATLQTRQAQLFMPIYSTYNSDEIMRAYSTIMSWKFVDIDDYLSKYGPEVNLDADIMQRKFNGYLEGVGVLVKRGLIDSSFVDDLMSARVINYWEKYGGLMREYRVRTELPQASEHVEYLYNRIKPIAERQRVELKRRAL
jgi:hypothetical protein